MRNISVVGRHIVWTLVASVFLLATTAEQVWAAAAGGLTPERSIRLSDNGASGGAITSGVGSGTNATYRVTFKAATSYTMKGIVLDICDGAGTPLIGDVSCSKPTSFTLGTTPAMDTANNTESAITATGIGSGWTATSVNSGQTLKLTNSTGLAVTAGTLYTFAITGVTNPSTVGTFYGRLLTYTSDTGDIATYGHDTPGSYQDYGGFALSTAQIVQITAKVQETLTFCMLGTTTPPTQTAPTDCADAAATSPAITLGHGPNNVLDAGSVDTNQVYSFVSTNALHGVIIRIHNNNACGGLSVDGGTTCGIPPVFAGAATTPASAMAAGTAALGLSVPSSANVTTNAPYDGDGSLGYYGMDTTTSGANATTTFGSRVVSSTGPTDNVMNTWKFAATASNTTAAGIYTANMAVIATGTF
ncbi:hypothetical protein KC976_01075 [Candidatus Saccharibacteria bacterium]|nr:hypothetical protein [Candidatus Saccharibacteria bacterium]